MGDGDIASEDILNHEDWYHRIPINESEYTPGRFVGPDYWNTLDLPDDLSGKTFLDVGTANGLMAFEAERRGAERVLGVDIWHNSAHKEGARMVKDYLGSDVELREINAYDVTPERVGHFDIVLCAGLIYHIANPYRVIDNIAAIANEKIVIETSLNQYGYLSDGILKSAGSAPPQPMRLVPNMQAVKEMVEATGVSVEKQFTCDVDDSRGGRNVPEITRGRITAGSEIYETLALDAVKHVVDTDEEVQILYQDRETVRIVATESRRFYGWVKPEAVDTEPRGQPTRQLRSGYQLLVQSLSSIQSDGVISTLHKGIAYLDGSGGRGVVHGKLSD